MVTAERDNTKQFKSAEFVPSDEDGSSAESTKNDQSSSSSEDEGETTTGMFYSCISSSNYLGFVGFYEFTFSRSRNDCQHNRLSTQICSANSHICLCMIHISRILRKKRTS